MEEKYGRKVSEIGKICQLWAVSVTGIGTRTGWYRYHLYRGQMVTVPTKVVSVPLTRTKVVPVPIQVVPVPLFPVAMILVFMPC